MNSDWGYVTFSLSFQRDGSPEGTEQAGGQSEHSARAASVRKL